MFYSSQFRDVRLRHAEYLHIIAFASSTKEFGFAAGPPVTFAGRLHPGVCHDLQQLAPLQHLADPGTLYVQLP